MNRFGTASVAMALAVGTMAQAQNAIVLYGPAKSVKDQLITVKGWGSGTASESDDVAYEGTHSISVSTRNYFQGGLLTFGAPISLEKVSGDKNNLLRIMIRTTDSAAPGRTGGMTGGKAGGGKGGGLPGGGGVGGAGGRGPGGGFPGGGFPGGGFPGGGFPGGGGAPGGGGFGGAGGGFPGGGQGGFPGRGGGQGGFAGGGQGGFPGRSTGNAGPAKFSTMRVIVSTTDGKKSEAYVPISTSSSGERGWKSVAIPLQSISGFDRTNKMVESIGFSGDVTTTFYVGDLRVVNDSTPLRVDANARTLNLALGDEFVFIANGSGGASILKYTWDFDDKDGIDIDAEGQVVRRKFRKAGTYTITLTVTDFFGLKPPFSTTLTAKVNP